jgi:hypothetical protein
VFQEPKGILPEREVEQEIKKNPDSLLPNIGLYREYVLEVDEMKKQLQQWLE